MAIYHFSAQIIGRSAGRSATAAAAYRAHERIEDDRTGLIHDYTRRRGDFDSFILTPDHAPDWTHDRAALWNAVEAAEKRSNAQVAREINLALPVELSRAEQKTLLQTFVKQVFVNEGKIADVSMHYDHPENPHAHIMLTMREIGADGFGKKIVGPTATRKEWAQMERAMLAGWREQWANFANSELRTRGYQEIDSRSLKDQGLDRLPQIHEGPHVRAMEEKGISTERGDWNRAAKEHARIDQEEKAVVVSLDDYREEKEALLQEIEGTTELPWKEHLCACIDEALANTSSFDEFQTFLQATYGVQTKIQNVNVSFLYPEHERFIRGSRLGERYTKEALEERFTNSVAATKVQETTQSADSKKQAGTIGTLVNHGPARYEHNPKNKPSYFVTIATLRGEKTLWGVDLRRAIDESDVKTGDRVHLQYQGSQPVTVQTPLYDQDGHRIGEQTISTKRNTWLVELAAQNQANVESIGRKRTEVSTRQTDTTIATEPHQDPNGAAKNENAGSKPAIIGTLLEHGAAPYHNDPKNKQSYFVTIATKRGEKTLWGVDLHRAIDVSTVGIGDRIQLQYQGFQEVTVPTHQYDPDGQIIGEQSIVTRRNAWHVDHAPISRQEQRAKNTQAKELARLDKLLNLYQKVDELKQEKEQNLQEINIWKNQGWNVKRQSEDVFKQLQKQTERLDQQIDRITKFLPWDQRLRILLEESRQNASSLQEIQTLIQDQHDITVDLSFLQVNHAQHAQAQPREPYAVIGTLLAHGAAPYNNDQKNKPSYFITIATDRGEKTIWGVDLQRAINGSDVSIGDRIRMDNLGSRQVAVQANVLDGSGQVVGEDTIQAQRNVWEIRQALPNERITRSPEQLREMRRKADEKWKDLYNDIELMEKYLALYNKLDLLKEAKEQKLSEIRDWHNQGWITRARTKDQLATLEQELAQLDKNIKTIIWQLPPEDRDALLERRNQAQSRLDVLANGIKAIDSLLQTITRDDDQPIQHIKKKKRRNEEQQHRSH